jgi:peptide deformylase
MKYKILTYPDSRLKQKAYHVLEFNEELRTIVRNMYETMYDAEGVGLAATQVDIHKRIITTCIDKQEITFINPELSVVGSDVQKYEEGCLSFPSMRVERSRPTVVQVSYQDVYGASHFMTCDHLLAVCIQHEIDHINGITFIDGLSPFKRQRLLDKYF